MFGVKIGDSNYPYFDVESGDSDFKNTIQNSKWDLYKEEYEKIDRGFIENLNRDDMEIYKTAVDINKEYAL
jgi:hypothetical protein